MTRVALAVLLFSSLAASGCLDFSMDYDKRPVREDRGPLLADHVVLARGTASTLAFTADGAEVVHVARGPDDPSNVLRAVRISDGVQRVLGGARPAAGTPLAPTADGTALYYFDGDDRLGADGVPPTFELREAFSGATISVTRWWQPRMLVASPSGRELLVSDADATVVLDLETGASTDVVCRDPAVFSPGSDAVLCRAPTATSWLLSLVPLAGQGMPPLLDKEYVDPPAALSWSENGMRVAFSTGRLVVGDPATGRELLGIGDGLGASEVVFTPDGGAVAGVHSECLAGDPFRCTRHEQQVVVVDVATGAERIIASSADEIMQLAISPDGKTIAYTVEAELHVRPTGR